MRNRNIATVLAFIALAAMMSAASMPLAGQERAAAASSWTPPRLPDGTPDLQGLYQPVNPGGMPGNNIEEHPPSFLRPGGKSFIIDPADGKIPYQPWALAERDRRRSPAHSYDDPEGHCFLSGVPRQMYISGGGGVFQVLQTPGYVLILHEYIHAYRIIPTDNRKHLPPAIRLWEGDSIGRWAGNTLVIDTTNNSGKTWFDLSGNFVSDAVHQLERMTLVDPNTIDYAVTITDPKVFTRPWTMALSWRRAQQQQGFSEILEQACHEGNRDLEHMKAVQEKGSR